MKGGRNMGWGDWQAYIPVIATIAIGGPVAWWGFGQPRPTWRKVQLAKKSMRDREVGTAKALRAIIEVADRHDALDEDEVVELISECMDQLYWRVQESDMLDAWTWPHTRPTWYEVGECAVEHDEED